MFATSADAGRWRWCIDPNCEDKHYVEGDSWVAGMAAAADKLLAVLPQATIDRCWITILNTDSTPTAACEGHSLVYVYAPVVRECLPGEPSFAQGCRAPEPAGTCHATEGNPVEVDTGHKIQSFTDWTSAGPHPLRLARYYSSNYAVTRVFNYEHGFTIDASYSRFGKAWRSDFDSRLNLDRPSTYNIGDPANPTIGGSEDIRVSIVMPDSRVYVFIYNKTLLVWELRVWNGSSFSTVQTNVDAKLIVANNRYSLTTPEGTVYRYDYQGTLREIEFPDGYTQTLVYTGTYNTSVTDSLGRTLTFTYFTDPLLAGFLKSVTLPDGKIISYTYTPRILDASGTAFPYATEHSEHALETVTYPDASPANATDNPKVTYQYWNNRSYPYALTGIIDERGVQVATFTYDAKGRALSTEHAGGVDRTTFAYDDVNNKVTVTNPLTKQTIYNYEIFQNHRRLTSVDGLVSSNCAASNTSYQYDANGYKNRETDAEGRVTAYVNDVRGRPTRITEAVGTAEERVTTLLWDPVSTSQPASRRRA